MNNTTRAAMVLAMFIQGLGAAGCQDRGSVTGPTVVVSTEQRSNVSLTGVVWDTDHRLVVGATVEIMDGHQAGDSTVTDGTGRFELALRFAGEMTTVRASKEGFLPATSTFVPANANRHIEFRLEPDRAH